jgi:glyoxylase-like metal-dependent hydrolase (beta-lactamase superfamily II)/rhodanese-related sulfurtransferase
MTRLSLGRAPTLRVDGDAPARNHGQGKRAARATMILKQYFLGCLAHASYLVADEESKTAAVVDPQRDIDQYLDDARKLGLKIGHVLLTHLHADFVAGHLELRDRVGAEIALGARAATDYPARRVRDGDVFELGPSVRLVALETPGHTPESITYAVYDSKKSPDAPHAVLTGDTLFIGDVGRPDLMAAKGASPSELARLLYRSLREKLLPLPDATLVYPAHGAGSACGKNMSSDTFSTLGVQKKVNWALQPVSEDEFVASLIADLPEAPRYFGLDADVNRRERSTLDAALDRGLSALPLDAALAKVREGAQLLDTREADDFARGHLAGSINIGLGGKYASWAGQVLDPARMIVLVAAPGRERESVMRLGRIGFDRVVGYVEGGPAAFEKRADLVRRLERVTPEGLAKRLGSPEAPFVVDVRAESEYRSSHLDGSLNLPLPHLEERLAEIPRGRPIVVHCQSGYRSMIATSLLERAGLAGLTDLAGGFAAWQKAKLATV